MNFLTNIQNLLYWKNGNNKKIKSFWKYLIYLILIAFFIFCLIDLNFFTIYPDNLIDLKNTIYKFFLFNSFDEKNFVNNSLWMINWIYFSRTIQYVVLGNFFGFIFSIFTAFYSTKKFHKNKYVILLVKFIIIFLRVLPVFVFISLISNSFSGVLGASLIIFWFTWICLSSYLTNLFENTSDVEYWQMIYSGKSKLKSFYENIILRNRPKIILMYFLSLESNIRWTTVLGAVGISGIGFLFELYQSKNEYLAITILYLFILIFSLEIIMLIFNKWLFNTHRLKTNSILLNNINNRKLHIVLLILFLVTVLISVGIIKDFQTQKINFHNFFRTLIRFLSPNFSDYNKSELNGLLWTWRIIKQSYVCLIISLFCSLTYSIFLSEKMNHWIISYIFRTVLSFLRMLPSIFVFYLLNIFLDSVGAMSWTLAFTSFRGLTKYISESINSIDIKYFEYYKIMKKNKIFTYKKLVLPFIKKDLISYIQLEFENTCRDSLFYGSFTGWGLGNLYIIYSKKDDIEKISAILIPITIMFVLFELISMYLRRNRR